MGGVDGVDGRSSAVNDQTLMRSERVYIILILLCYNNHMV